MPEGAPFCVTDFARTGQALNGVIKLVRLACPALLLTSQRTQERVRGVHATLREAHH